MLGRYSVDVGSSYPQWTLSKGDYSRESGWASFDQLRGFRSKMEVFLGKKTSCLKPAASAPAGFLADQPALQTLDLPPTSLSRCFCFSMTDRLSACLSLPRDSKLSEGRDCPFHSCVQSVWHIVGASLKCSHLLTSQHSCRSRHGRELLLAARMAR